MTQTQVTPFLYGSALTGGNASYHQQWFLVDHKGHILSQQLAEPLQTVSVLVRFGVLRCTAPGMLSLELPLDVLEDDDEVRCQAIGTNGESIAVIDEGGLAATWFSNVMGLPCRLMKKDPGHPDK